MLKQEPTLLKNLSGAQPLGRFLDLPANSTKRLERLARDKHSNLIQKFVKCGQNDF
jgi:hypothetical protein